MVAKTCVLLCLIVAVAFGQDAGTVESEDDFHLIDAPLRFPPPAGELIVDFPEDALEDNLETFPGDALEQEPQTFPEFFQEQELQTFPGDAQEETHGDDSFEDLPPMSVSSAEHRSAKIVHPCERVRCPQGTTCTLSAKNAPQCVNAPSCASVSCLVGTTCQMQIVNCVRAPCNPVPVCVTNQVPPLTCANINCQSGFACEMQQNTPKCVGVPSCSSVSCHPGTTCQMQIVNCGRAPCNPVPVCVTNPVPVFTCANVICQGGFVCQMQQAQPVCVNPCQGVRCPSKTKCTINHFNGPVCSPVDPRDDDDDDDKACRRKNCGRNDVCKVERVCNGRRCELKARCVKKVDRCPFSCPRNLFCVVERNRPVCVGSAFRALE